MVEVDDEISCLADDQSIYSVIFIDRGIRSKVPWLRELWYRA